MVADGGGYRYVNNHLWNAIRTEGQATDSPAATSSSTPVRDFRHYRPPGDSVAYESPVDPEIAGRSANGEAPRRHFLFDRPQPQAFQPPPHHIVQLWQTYLSNVDPILKIVHAPTLQQTILGSIGKPEMPSNLQALTSAIYLVSVVSLESDECETVMQVSRAELLTRYRQATEDGLSAAGFVTTADLIVLQALIFYLAALRSLGETAAVWTLTGLAIRLAGVVGLARDGTVLNLPPFETEMRRRLWWAIIYLDARTAEIVGQEGDLLTQRSDVHLPANLNDTQLFPSMQRLPESRPAATEMAYIMLRAMLASNLNAMPGSPGSAGTWQRIRATSVPMADKATIVENLEARFHEEILRFCDPTVPLQSFTMNSAQTFLVKMRLVGNIPYDRSPATAGSADGYSENLFQLGMKMMRLQLDLFTDPALRKWKWHWRGHFQWYALAELLRQTRLRPSGPETMKAWRIIKEVFDDVVPQLEFRPEKSALIDAVQALFDTARKHRNRIEGADQEQAESAQAEAGAPSDIREVSPHKRQMMGFSIAGQGSRPFSALLPAMDCMQTPSSLKDQGTGTLDESTMALDFDAIDWAEFDRLTSQLCGQ